MASIAMTFVIPRSHPRSAGTEQGECVPLTPDRLMNTTKLVTGAVALVQGIATALPYVQRVRQRWAQERARRARERILKEIADREAMLARVRQEHSTPLRSVAAADAVAAIVVVVVVGCCGCC